MNLNKKTMTETNPTPESNNDDIKKEVEARENKGKEQFTGKDPYLESAKKIEELTGQKGLGNVNDTKENTRNISPNPDMILGWHPIHVEEMPSAGLFYPSDISITIRAAQVAEIRHWSTLNERDMFDVEDKLNHIMQNCCKIQSRGRILSWKDILEEDRIFVILAIRELTFKDGENKLQVEKQCVECGHKNVIEIKNKNWTYNKLPADLIKYYDDEKRLLAIQTKSFGVIEMKPPTIGVFQIVTKFIQDKNRAGEYWDQSYTQILPYLQKEWRGFIEKDIFNGEVDFKGWDEKKYMLYYRLAEKVKIGVKPDISCKCSECDAEVIAQVNFQQSGGVKGLFAISDITGELL